MPSTNLIEYRSGYAVKATCAHYDAMAPLKDKDVAIETGSKSSALAAASKKHGKAKVVPDSNPSHSDSLSPAMELGSDSLSQTNNHQATSIAKSCPRHLVKPSVRYTNYYNDNESIEVAAGPSSSSGAKPSKC